MSFVSISAQELSLVASPSVVNDDSTVTSLFVTCSRELLMAASANDLSRVGDTYSSSHSLVKRPPPDAAPPTIIGGL